MIPKKIGRPRGLSVTKPAEATAATKRPRRVVLEKPTAAESAATPVIKKRGRPAKQAAVEDEPAAKRKRGRPAKAKVAEAGDSKNSAAKPQSKTTATAPNPGAKKQGRPAKAATAEQQATPAKRGRPPANKTTPNVPKVEATPPKKRGRPPANKTAPAVSEAETAPPKKRGRPPKGGETTKITSNDSAAAEQLEEELMETADEPEAADDADTTATDGDASDEVLRERALAAQSSGSGKQFWLMKAEQEDREEETKSGKIFNTKFTIDDLRAKGGPEPWDGVRNVVASKHMRAMQQGDLAFFYASGGKAGRKPGIVGIMEVVQAHSPDPSTADDEHYAYVEKEADRAKWCVVHVEYRKKLSKPVLLSDLQKHGKDGGVLGDMDVLKYSRLSVSRVTEKEWDFIHENLVEGFEEEIEAFPASSVVEDAKAVVTETAAKTVDALESTYTAITETASNLIQNAASALSPVPTASAL